MALEQVGLERAVRRLGLEADGERRVGGDGDPAGEALPFEVPVEVGVGDLGREGGRRAPLSGPVSGRYRIGWTIVSELPSGSRSQNIGGIGSP